MSVPAVGRPVLGRKMRSKAATERMQSAVSYAILLTFLLFVIFPFYWMAVTSFKSEEQMRSLVSMFWPFGTLPVHGPTTPEPLSRQK